MSKQAQAPVGFDLSVHNLSAVSEAGYEFEAVYPADESIKTGIFIKVRGDQSPIAQAHWRRTVAENQMRQKAAARKGKEVDLSLDELMEMTVEKAVNRIIGWRGVFEGGEPVLFDTNTATRLLTTHTWLRDAILEAAGEVQNFRP